MSNSTATQMDAKGAISSKCTGTPEGAGLLTLRRAGSMSVVNWRRLTRAEGDWSKLPQGTRTKHENAEKMAEQLHLMHEPYLRRGGSPLRPREWPQILPVIVSLN